MKRRKVSHKQLDFIRALVERVGESEAARISMSTLRDPAGKPVNVFNPTTHPGASSFGRTRQVVEFISSTEATNLINALQAAALPTERRLPDAPEGMRRLDRLAARLGVQLDAWGKTGRSFEYRPGLILRYRPQGKGTYYMESREGETTATAVVAADRIERYFMGVKL